MNNQFTHNDQPISKPDEDRFGIDPFAAALARSIQKIESPLGSVIALNGPWGSGKSSALNLIRHHLSDAVEREEITVIDFACWWFRGEEALALAFFRELYAGMSPSIGDKLKRSLPKLGARLLKAGGALGGAIDLAGAGGVGAVAGGAMEWLGGLIEQDESVEKLHGELSRALADQPRRFLVVIDDIDRLSPDEALLIFRLVKSVGRLPNVMYLLVYDRLLAEKIVSERFPSEGPHYLEKIVQAAFELPEPMTTDLHQYLLSQIIAICGEPPHDRIVRLMNVFYEGVAPEMRTPRDLARLTNSLAVTWPAVAEEVDVADFVALEVLRLLHPEIYRAIRQNKSILCGLSACRRNDSQDDRAKEYEMLFLRTLEGVQRDRLRKTLMRVFPALESAWGNMHYGNDFRQEWANERRVCSETYFDTYFRFAIGADVISAAELRTIIGSASDPIFISHELRNAVSIKRHSGTKAAVVLDELNVHAAEVKREDVQPLLTRLFMVADDINVEEDHGKGFSMINNDLRLHWLLRSLTRGRFSLPQRSEIFMAACQSASLGWLASFVGSAWADYHPREGKEREPEEGCLTTEADAGALRKMLQGRLVEAAKGGQLLVHKELAYLLYRWLELSGEEGGEIKEWTALQLATNEGVRNFCRAFTSYSWTQSLGFGGLGDLVAQRKTQAQVKGVEKLMDVNVFRRRVEEVATAEGFPEVITFLDAWRSQDQGDREW